MIGTTLAHYRITASLGAGGMGEVWQATDTKLGREVALKVLPAEFASDEERLARFEREAKVLASLNHPNIAHLYGLETATSMSAPDASGTGTEKGTGTGPVTFLVMELVEGDGLDQVISRGPVSVEDAIPIALQIAEALEAAHEAGIVHRDLKPANVRIRPDGTVKVLDFGLAKAWEAGDGDSSLSLSPTLTRHATAAGVILGTAAYMSPEQARGKPVDRRADIWAFGVVLWEMLTGRKLFDGETVSDLIAGVLRADVDLEQLPSRTPEPVRRLIARCLRRDPRTRQQWIGDARLELLDTDGRLKTATVNQDFDRRRRWIPWVVAAVGVTVAIASIFVPRRSSESIIRPVAFDIDPPVGAAFDLESVGPAPFTVSPDGSRIVFGVRDVDGTDRLCVRALDSLGVTCLAGTEGAQYPFWSPDGRHIGFFARAGAALKTIPADDGAIVTLSPSRNGKGGTWNADGTIVFTPDSNAPLFAVSASGGEPRPLTELDEERGDNSHRHPQILPDGRRFLYLARSARGPNASTVRVGSVDGDVNVELVRSPAAARYAAGHLLYLNGTNLMARRLDLDRLELRGDEIELASGVLSIGGAACGLFSASDDVLVVQRGVYQDNGELVWLDRSGNRLGVLGKLDSYTSPAISPDGSAVAIPIPSDEIGTTDMWVFDIGRNLRSRVTFHPAEDSYPAWAPDGRDLYFSSNRDGPFNVYRVTPGSSDAAVRVNSSAQATFCSAVSPDGTRLLATRIGNTTAADLIEIDLEDGGSTRVFRETRFNEEYATYSPDGLWVAYTSDESGRSEVYVTPSSGDGRHWQVSSDGGKWPRWAHDTGELVFSDDRGRVMSVSVDPDGYDVRIDTPEVLFSGDATTSLFPRFDLSPDASRILMVVPSDTEAPDPPTVTIGWSRGLERR